MFNRAPHDSIRAAFEAMPNRTRPRGNSSISSPQDYLEATITESTPSPPLQRDICPSHDDGDVYRVSPPRDGLLDLVFSQRDNREGNFFRPSRAVGDQHFSAIYSSPPSTSNIVTSHLPINPNYRGIASKVTNQNPFLPDIYNCAIWLEGIPANATVREILSSIRRIGRVYSTHLNPPTGQYNTSAAKLVFMTATAAQHFLSLANSVQGHRIAGAAIRARYNRNKYTPHTKPWESRVLRLKGPKCFVNRDFLLGYIEALMVADVVEIVDLKVCEGEESFGIAEMEWHFGSVMAQAAALKLAIELEPALRSVVEVVYGPDPCE